MENALSYVKADTQDLLCISRVKDVQMISALYPLAECRSFRTERIDFADVDICNQNKEAFSEIIIVSNTPFCHHLTKLIYQSMNFDYERIVVIDCNGEKLFFTKKNKIHERLRDIFYIFNFQAFYSINKYL